VHVVVLSIEYIVVLTLENNIKDGNATSWESSNLVLQTHSELHSTLEIYLILTSPLWIQLHTLHIDRGLETRDKRSLEEECSTPNPQCRGNAAAHTCSKL
jgi:hypothetical protein